MEMLPWILGALNLVCAILCIALARPLVQRKVKPNHYYGIRFAKSFESDELWYQINEFGGRRLIFWSIPIGLCGLLVLVAPLPQPVVLGLAFAPMLLLVGCIESYRFAKRL